LLIEAAVRDPNSLPSAAQYLPGYDGQIHLLPLLWLLLRLIAALYLLASALAAYDRKSLSGIEIAIRLALAALIMFKDPVFHGPALIAGVVLLAYHYLRGRSAPAGQAS
jgi:hypothetical protein